jgi:phosphoserine aminotransferase
VFKWLKAKGGLAEMERINILKSGLVYNYIDSSDFYNNPVVMDNRSRMNIPFTLRNNALDGEFLKQAQQNGLLQLRGHKLIGGMRASIYNAMPIEGVQTLVEFMRHFEQTRG